jgi:hypothetical protein
VMLDKDWLDIFVKTEDKLFEPAAWPM